jgi:DnaJ-class molecular chaperone
MEAENYYDILGLRPDASHRELLSAFGRLAERYRRQMSDPAARGQFEQAKAAYQTLTDYGSRLRYNIERGLPDPPKHGKGSQEGSAIDGLASLIPGNWHVYAFVLVWLVCQIAFLFERKWIWDHTSHLLP